MAVPAGPTEQRYVGNGVSTIYAVPFLVIQASDLAVYVDGVKLTSGYTQSGVGNPTSSVIFSVAPANLAQILFTLEVPFERLNDYQENGDFLARTVNNDFDRIWQALKQLYSWATRSLRLGTTDVDGQGWYRAKNNGIRDLRDPVQPQDAATMHWTDVFVSGLLSAITGPINNALNIFYRYPDNSSHVVQDLSGTTGAYGIGRGASTVGAALDGHDASIAANAQAIIDTLNAIPVSNIAQPLVTRSNKILSNGQGVVILGDSISAGAYFGNGYTNGWPYLLAKAINSQFGAQNLGAIPLDSLYNVVAAYNTDQIHAVTWFGDWGTRTSSPAPYNIPLGNVGTAAGDAVNGKTVVSTNSGAYVEIVVPSLNPIITIYYVARPDGGKFDVTVNGVLQPELDTFNSLKVYNQLRVVNIPDNGQGEVTIRLTKKDTSPTEIQPIVKYQSGIGGLFDHLPLMNVCNYSISGRQLGAMTEIGIIAATNCACLVLALGYNDRFAETDDTYYATFLQRINWVIQYANINKCLVIVADFCWYSGPTARVRTQLKRVAQLTKGVYIPFPDKIYPDGAIPVDTTPTASELVDPLMLWADNAHPNYKGEEVIFSQVARAMGLAITSKRLALLNDMPFPLKLQGTLRNKAGSKSTVTRTNRGLLYSLGVTASGGGTIPSGAVPLAAVPSKYLASPTLRASVDVIRMSTVTPGSVAAFAVTAEDGSVSATLVEASEVVGSYVVAERLT